MGVFAILAEAAPAPSTGASGGLLNTLLQNAFYLGLILVFLVAIIGAFIAARKRDRCLKKFARHRVTICEQAGRRIWGELKVFSKGLELVYEQPLARPAKNSFLMYEAELGKMLAIFRFVDRLTDKGLRARQRQAVKLADPPITSRAWRWMRSVVNTFRDAIISAMGMTVQQAAKASPTPALQAQGGQINAIGSLLVGETANAYEPMIEQYIGAPVILEVVNPAGAEKRIVEYHGYLGEYSPQFVLLVDVRDRFHESVPIGETRELLEGAVTVRAEKAAVHVSNRSAVPLVVEGIHAGQVCHEVNATVEPGASADVPVPEAAAQAEGAVAAVSWQREFDLIVPRAIGIIRHASDAPEGPSAQA